MIHSFKIIAMRVTQDAIPGMRIPIHFTPTKEGRYQINCAQLCGNGHSSMSQGFLVVESQEAFDKWLASHTKPEARRAWNESGCCAVNNFRDVAAVTSRRRS